MALSPTHVEAPKVVSKGPTHSSHKKTSEKSKDAFKKLLELKKKEHGKKTEAKADKPKVDLKKVPKKGKELKDLKNKLPEHIAPDSPLAHLLNSKKNTQLKPEKPEKLGKKQPPLDLLQHAKAPKDVKLHGKQAKLSDIKNLESAKQLKLGTIKHEKDDKGDVEKNTLGKINPKEIAKNTPLVNPNKAILDDLDQKKTSKEEMDKSEKTTKLSTQELLKPKTTQTPAPQATKAPTTPLAHLLEQKPMPRHAPIKDNATNDREIKEAFKQALEGPLKPKRTFIPLSFDPNRLPLYGPAQNPISKEGDEDSKPKAIESAHNNAHNAHLESKSPIQAPQIKETLKNFATTLRQELLDFKPPITKLSMELNPDKLGKVDVVIQQVGKNIQVSVASSAPVSALLSSYQNELRQNLAQMGFSDVNLSFSSHGGGQGGGFQQGAQQQQQQGHFANPQPQQNPQPIKNDEPNSPQEPNKVGLPQYA
ncbi:flagellar hook-length control protein FliK [Helicobacter mehlei]|uniref:flagellar hook-length control protein FliK n=1 Tax=Helicobacter mehlei TaxID=2316080 RepID=UPI0013CE1321|nr:flagellar hook-length control protein FliK [Helicobacter mehlei]